MPNVWFDQKCDLCGNMTWQFGVARCTKCANAYQRGREDTERRLPIALGAAGFSGAARWLDALLALSHDIAAARGDGERSE